MTGGRPHLALAEHWLDVGRPENALDELDRAGLEAVSRDGLALRARAQLRLGSAEQAAETAERGLAAAPGDVGLLGLLAAAEAAKGDPEAAERALLRALHVAPDTPGLLVYYAYLLGSVAQFDKAQRVLDRAARVAPDDPAVFAERADLALARGRKREARRWAREALARDPENEAARRAAGSAASAQGAAGEARRYFYAAAADDMSDQDLRHVARQAGFLAHPLLVPLRLVTRLGALRTYLLAMLLIFVLAVVSPVAGAVMLATWTGFVVYTWTVPALLRRWLRSRGRL